ncbi:MAG: DUF2934 domain-containing protein [Gemmataceae bacterium]|nr:DUF2934 domain-containing protein [Gemmataceae bacterium]
MSRISTPQTAQPGTPQQLKAPHEKIAQRAYEKWVKKGRPQGTHTQDWVEAEQEIQNELARGYTGSPLNQPSTQPRR